MNARIALIPVLLTLAACDDPVKEPGTDPSTDTGAELDTGTETDTDTEEPIDCETGDWSDWSDCSAECGGGTRERTREVTVPAANGGEECGELFEEEECNTDACDVIDVSVVHYDGGGVSRLNSTSWSSSSSEGTEIWTEQLRDEWSVYLSNDGGDELQLDLWTQEVYITPQGGNREVLAAITESDPSRLNGWSGTRAVYDGGAFVQLDETLWVENNENGPHTWPTFEGVGCLSG